MGFLFLFFASVFAAEYVVHYCVEEKHFPHFMLGCTSDDCSSWQHNCRHVKIFDNLDHALWFINGERPKRKISYEEREGFVYLIAVMSLDEEEFPFANERKKVRNFKLVALYETKEISLDKQVNVEEIVTKTTKETIKYAFYKNTTQ
jgi:hypothetical protein